MTNTCSSGALCDLLSQSVAEGFYVCLERVSIHDQNQPLAYKKREYFHASRLLFLIVTYPLAAS
ncbi:MAG: hypothetical protein VYB20_09220, partial [Pseudomonadota bacterium]|nr:hypothetical protein [Pseudomonadota bacterium]